MKQNNTYLLSIGTKIKALRLKKKLSQEALANASWLHATYISHIESWKRNISVLALRDVCKALWVTASDILKTK